jgi:hypothetical protein
MVNDIVSFDIDDAAMPLHLPLLKFSALHCTAQNMD